MATKSKISFYSIFFKLIVCVVLIASAMVIGFLLTNIPVIMALFSPDSVMRENLYLEYYEIQDFAEMALLPAEQRTAEQTDLLNEMIYEGYCFFVPGNEETFPYPDSSDYIYLQSTGYNDVFFEISITSERWNSEYDQISDDIATAEIYLWVGIIALFLMIISTVIFGVLSGQRERGGEVIILPFNRIFNDILTVVFVGIVAIIAAFVAMMWSEIFYFYSQDFSGGFSTDSYVTIGTAVLYVGIAVLCLLWLYYINCIAKRIKRREFFAYTTIGAVFRFIKRICVGIGYTVKNMYNKKIINYIVLATVLFVGLTAVLPLFLAVLFNALETYLVLSLLSITVISTLFAIGALRRIGELDTIKRGLAEIRSGNTHHRILPVKSSLLADMVDDINNISEGLENSVESAMISERMKTELITNVSHDLKTPLTSIIGYVDLLSKVDDLPEEALDYTRILQSKSSQLSGIISDLFDLAKSSSGNAELVMERLDLKKLIEQTLADLQDNIDSSELIIKTTLPMNEVMIEADGNRLSRVFRNLVDNALKYSMQGSRVYIKLLEENGIATAEILNISAHEITFTEQEILQRFTRGDESRTTEGNGLGLSIAKSFTELCKGKFDIKLEGDMFKITVGFKTVCNDDDE